MPDIHKRLEKIKKKRRIILPSHRPQQLQSLQFTAELLNDLSSRLNQIQTDIRHNNKSVNFANRLDMYGLSLDGDLSSFSPDIISFDSRTDFSKCKLPPQFSPDNFLDQGKGYGQNIEELHKKGITGKGVKIAIIDQPLSDHKEYHHKLLHYEEVGFEHKALYGNMHGAAVTSLAVGNTCGIAPDAEVYYWGTLFSNPYPNGGGDNSKKFVVESLRKCIELNRKLPKNEKIQAVSISGCFDRAMEGYEEYMQLRKEATKDGLEVITCSLYKEKGLSMNGFNRDMTKDINDTDNIIPIYNKIDKRIEEDWFSPNNNKTLLISCDHRTLASEKGYDDYMHAARGGFSWLPPQIVGMYALAKQVNPNCTFEHMWQTGLDTGVRTDKLNGVAVSPTSMINKLQQEYQIQKIQNNILQETKNNFL